jgi:hypothetical protein
MLCRSENWKHPECPSADEREINMRDTLDKVSTKGVI